MIAIVAHAKDLAIGRGNELPWHVPEDLRFFKKKSSEFVNVLFGTNTFNSFKGFRLAGRKMCLLSSGNDSLTSDYHFKSVSEVLKFSQSNEIIIAGGAQIYKAFAKHITRFYITRIDLDVDEADTFLFDYTDMFELCSVIETGDNYSIEMWVPKNV
ncbi:dihydrofolate reductase [Pseudoalteromonas marina]|uniref:dihydrofolate reductase n=1 Tax=Pseudoalteromonas marina TaxID=267375 RepID=A0ABT9FC06_9GAMM|nr:dihydrofolate reductase [Pseudoalteromonas marina]MDP2564300.1 dihydrofolate reductase [Pseudoalteromonas marina]